jgi:hypothetical protein
MAALFEPQMSFISWLLPLLVSVVNILMFACRGCEMNSQPVCLAGAELRNRSARV